MSFRDECCYMIKPYLILIFVGFAFIAGWITSDTLNYFETIFPGSPGGHIIIGGRYYTELGGYGVIFSTKGIQRGRTQKACFGIETLKSVSEPNVNVTFIPKNKNFNAPTISLACWLHNKAVFLTDVGLTGQWLIKSETVIQKKSVTGRNLVRFAGRWVSGGRLHAPYFDYKGVRYRYNALDGHWKKQGNLIETPDSSIKGK